jgi:hypothetical protein
MALPARGWVGLGSPPGANGYRYRDRARSLGPCTGATLTRKRFRVRCTGQDVGFTLDEPQQGSLRASVALGTEGLRACFSFGGTIHRDAVGIFQAKRAPAPTFCP